MAQLSLREIQDRANAFAKRWCGQTDERAEAQTFWNEFFYVFGLDRYRIARFEASVKKYNRSTGKADVFWKGVLLAEHKSAGKDLTEAYQQAMEYYEGLKRLQQKDILPRYIIVCDFETFELHDLQSPKKPAIFPLQELYKNIDRFGFMTEYGERRMLDEAEEFAVSVEAARLLGNIHAQLKENQRDNHDLKVYMIRLLFCCFADDTGIFDRGIFREYLYEHAKGDGSDLGLWLEEVFETLNTPQEQRSKYLPDDLRVFPYINGGIFSERLRHLRFSFSMYQDFLQVMQMDWGEISPAIFGSMFQSAMDEKERRNLGAHYTSEANILKALNPLFLDDLRAELERTHTKQGLLDLQMRMASLLFLDPACGCGNFLITAYKHLRLIELDLLRKLYPERKRPKDLDIRTLSKIDIYQFWGMEVEELPARIAQVALWLTEHQMNRLLTQEFGEHYLRIPLKDNPNVLYTNALHQDWTTILPAGDTFDYLIGNPPFIGKQLQTAAQKADMKRVCGHIGEVGVLDYVTAWYIKAAQYMDAVPKARTAFVSTNSIAQGEQVGVLWRELFLRHAIKIQFAHQTFKWHNEAGDVAAVYCIIVGFGKQNLPNKTIFEYKTVKDESPTPRAVSNISPYLVEAGDVFVIKRKKPLCNVPEMMYGNKIVDDGHFLFTEEEKDTFLRFEPKSANFFRQILSGSEFINGRNRYCLWLKDAAPNELSKLPAVRKRIEAVKKFRLSSAKEQTKEAAKTPQLFAEFRQPDTDFLLIPRTSSENRRYVPMAFFDKSYIVNDSCIALPHADNFLFGVLTSQMHMAWMRYVCGRLKSDYRYSNTIVYNNYPFPQGVSAKQRAAVEVAAQAVLEARAAHLPPRGNASFADLYDPLSMPVPLLKAHAALDKAVDACYRKEKFETDAERVAFLFRLYETLSQPQPPTA